MIRIASWRRCSAAVIVSALVLASMPLWAGQVTSLADSGSGSLRAAVAAGGNVTFASGLAGTITLTTGQIVVPSGTTIDGPAADVIAVDASNSGRIFDIASASTVWMSGLKLTGGKVGAGERGGAIRNAGVLVLGGMEISNSTAGDAGGAVYNNGTLYVIGSLLTGNSVSDSTCAGGGAIRSEGTDAGFSIKDSTITLNSATPCNGGGISVSGGTPEIISSTIVGNSAGLGGGNVYKGSAATWLTLNSSVIAGGSTGGGVPVNADLHGAFGGGLASMGRNLVQARGDGMGYLPSDLADGTDPQLDALTIHDPQGGPLRTIGFAWSSPLRDAVAAPCATDFDQRNVQRPQGSSCDIGAFEYRTNRLEVSVTGIGTVSAGPTPIPRTGSIDDCSTNCSAGYDGETGALVTVHLVAAPGPNQLFSGWGGDCAFAGAAPVDVPMDMPHTCTATFVPDTYLVTPGVNGGNGSIDPAMPQTVTAGDTTSFTLLPNANYHVDGAGGTCGGVLVGNVYTTNPVNADCTVIAGFAIDRHAVMASAGPHGVAAPTMQLVDHGAAAIVTLMPDANYHVASVSATGCGGTLSGSTYTIAPVTADCAVNATFAIDMHTVTGTAGAHGAIAPPTQTVDHNTVATLTLTPEAHYHVASATGCGGTLSGTTYTTAPVTTDCTVNATFAIDTHTVTGTAGAHGAITPPTQTVDHNAVATLTLTPEAHYHVASATGCGGTLSGTTYTTAPVTTDCTVNATFAIDTHTVTGTAGAHGAITPPTQTVDHNTVATLTLTPAEHYHVASATGCGGTLSGTTYTTAPVTTDCTVNATFAIDTHTVTGTAGAHGAITPPTQTVEHNTVATLTLTPAEHYHVASATGCGGTLSGTTYTTAPVTTDCTVNATFAIDTHTVTGSAGAHGAIAPTTQTVDDNAVATLTLTPDEHYHIDDATGCGGTLSGTTYTTAAVTADCTVSATFSIDTHTVTGTADAHGAIDPPTQTVDHNAVATLTLTPDEHYHVADATGCGGTLSGATYTTAPVIADCTVSATFAIDTHTVTGTAGANGTIAPATQTVDDDAVAMLTLTPDAHYHVYTANGCDGTLSGTTYTTAPVTADCTVDANFAIDTYTIGGSVTGLLGSGLVLQLNGANDLLVTPGNFAFAQPLDDLGTYSVTIVQQPVSPAQLCSVGNGSGALDGADVTDIVVSCAAPQPHLSVTVTDDRDYARYGMLLNYVVNVTNDGDGDATGVTLHDVLPPQLDEQSTSWICFGAGAGATCTESGTGALSDTNIAIPIGRTLTWLVSAPVRGDAPGSTVDYQVDASGPDSATATDSDVLVILRTGFDVAYDGGAESGADADECHGTDIAPHVLDDTATLTFGLPVTPIGAQPDVVLRGQTVDGSGFRVERAGDSDTTRLRLVAIDHNGIERASAWTQASASATLALGIVTTSEHSSLLLEGALVPLDIALQQGGRAEFRVTPQETLCR